MENEQNLLSDYEYEERVAICMIDGGLTESEAKRIAFKQIMSED